MFHNSFNTRTLKVFSFITRKKCQVLSIGIDRYRHLFADFRIFGDTEILTDGVSTSAPNFSQETSEVAATASSPIISLFVFISIRF